jgi:hypothetical protein
MIDRNKNMNIYWLRKDNAAFLRRTRRIFATLPD